MTNVIDINKELNVFNAEDTLKAAKEAGLEDVLVVGYSADDHLFIGSSIEKVAEANLLLDIAKQYLMETTYEPYE